MGHIVGYTLQEMSFPADEYPDLAEHVMQHLEGPGQLDEGDFELGLDLILDGIDRIRDRT